jgi:hypothetical protein
MNSMIIWAEFLRKSVRSIYGNTDRTQWIILLHENTLFPVLKNRIYKKVHGKGSRDGKCVISKI